MFLIIFTLQLTTTYNMSTYLLVDDESRGRELLSILLKRINPDCTIITAPGVDEAIKLYFDHNPALVFLDVEMPKKNGFEFVHELIHLGKSPRIVFVTAFNQYAIEAIKASALDYLLKPVNEEDLRICMNRIIGIRKEEVENQKMMELLTKIKMNHRLKINTRTGFEVINPKEILYCKADGNYTDICMIDGKKITTSNTLGLVEKGLTMDEFYRISRSVIINLNYLKSVDRKERFCEIEYGEFSYQLPLSLTRIQDLSNIF